MEPSAAPAYESVDVAPVWAGHPVQFCLLTAGSRQYVAYYDAERRMTVASRTLPDGAWTYSLVRSAPSSPTSRTRPSPTTVGWDSHNYIRMALDDDGYLHLAGNMHVHPLTYFRSTEPYDAATLEQVPTMVGDLEDQCTYPEFLRGPRGELVFHYRHGWSGHGNEIYNVYDTPSRTWRRLLSAPLTDGQGLMNAYMLGPLTGPDGYYHLSWVWRDTPACETNHDLSYARSRDLVHWETASGEPIVLPMRLDTPGVVVDPVPVGGGIINGTGRIGFDSRGRVTLAYHKFDAAGNTQAYVARLEEGAWRIRQVTDWDYRWWFEGGGSIIVDLRLEAVRPAGAGRLALPFWHRHYGSHTLLLDEETLAPVGDEDTVRPWPRALEQPESTFPEMTVQWAADWGTGEGSAAYYLRWETLPAHRDVAREGPIPGPSMLRVYRFRR